MPLGRQHLSYMRLDLAANLAGLVDAVDENERAARHHGLAQHEVVGRLGAVLEALPDGGVQVIDVVEGGSASATGLLKKRDKLTDISRTDAAGATFDETMEVLMAADAEVTLGISRTMIVKVKREVLA